MTTMHGLSSLAVTVAASPARAAPDRWRSLRRELYAAHEAVMGRATLGLARALMRSQWASADELAAIQLNKARALVDLARGACPYYRELGLPAGAELRGLEEVARLPMLDRATLRAQGRRLCVERPGQRRLSDTSSGTSEGPVVYYWDRRRQAWDKAQRIRGHAWVGFDLTDRELHLWPIDPARDWRGRTRQSLRARRDGWLGDLQIDPFVETNATAVWNRWRRFDPARVTAYPSVLAEFIVEARRRGCRLYSPNLRRVMLTGEVTLDWQREVIERELGVGTAQSYGVQEAGAVAFECEAGSWHVASESTLVEIVRDGRPARPGEWGEVVLTGLESRTMPLIRYRTGDVARATAETACACGRGLPTMGPVLGRAGDFLRALSGRWISPGMAVAQLGEVVSPGTFQVTQAETGRIEIDVLEGPRTREDWRAALAERCAAMVGRGVGITVRRVARLARCASGKMRAVRSRMTEAGLAGAARGAVCEFGAKG